MSGFAFSLLAFVLALSPLVFLHELGHYLMAKACGVRVDSFSIGFGPQLLGWTDKAGTRWKISLFLLGGYVKMAGDENIASSVSSQGAKEAKEATDTFESKSPWQKILIAVSGPFANYLTAFIILCPLFVLVGKPDSKPIIGQVVASSMAASAGLHQGDRITNVQDQPITRFGEMLTVLGNTPLTQNLKLHVVRDSIEKEVIVPSPSKEGVWKGNLGISPDPAFLTFFPLTLDQATTDVLTLMNPVKTIKSMSMASMGGPIKIGQDAGKFLDEGWELFLYFVGMVSIALGFFNLLPFPLLDGGMVLFSVIEIVIRRPLPSRVQQTVSFIAFLGLGSLFVYLSWKDLVSIPRVHEWLQALGLI